MKDIDERIELLSAYVSVARENAWELGVDVRNGLGRDSVMPFEAQMIANIERDLGLMVTRLERIRANAATRREARASRAR